MSFYEQAVDNLKKNARKVVNLPSVFENFPRNDIDYEGGFILFDVDNYMFYEIGFSSGDSLDEEDDADVCYSYAAYKWDGEVPLSEVINNITEGEEDLECTDGVNEIDGGFRPFKSDDYVDGGDIRKHLEEALDTLNFPGEDHDRPGTRFNGLMFIKAID